MNYEIDIEINPSELDQEWINQPALALRYTKYWAKEKSKLDKLEEGIKLIRAELIKEVNENPEGTCGVAKPTGVIIEAYYRNHKRHIEQKEKIVQARYDLDIAEAAKKEISITRKAALENLVKLLGLNYFSAPSVPRDISYSTAKSNKEQAISKEVNKNVGKRLKRRKE